MKKATEEMNNHLVDHMAHVIQHGGKPLKHWITKDADDGGTVHSIYLDHKKRHTHVILGRIIPNLGRHPVADAVMEHHPGQGWRPGPANQSMQAIPAVNPNQKRLGGK
jgi:hypothetical protein